MEVAKPLKKKIIKGKYPTTRRFSPGERDEDDRLKYVVDEDVLPPNLVGPIRVAFEGHNKLFTVLAGGPLNSSEEKLGFDLAWKLRIALNTPTKGSTRLMVRGQRNKLNVNRDLVAHLINEGYSMQVIAWALGMHVITLRRYRLGKCNPVHHVPEKTATINAGLSILLKVYGLDGDDEKHSVIRYNNLSAAMNKSTAHVRWLANEIGYCKFEAAEWKKNHKPKMYEILTEPKSEEKDGSEP